MKVYEFYVLKTPGGRLFYIRSKRTKVDWAIGKTTEKATASFMIRLQDRVSRKGRQPLEYEIFPDI